MVKTDFWESKHMKVIFAVFFGTLMFYHLMYALFLGSWLGIKIYNQISGKLFSWLVLVMLSINAFVLLLTT